MLGRLDLLPPDLQNSIAEAVYLSRKNTRYNARHTCTPSLTLVPCASLCGCPAQLRATLLASRPDILAARIALSPIVAAPASGTNHCVPTARVFFFSFPSLHSFNSLPHGLLVPF